MSNKLIARLASINYSVEDLYMYTFLEKWMKIYNTEIPMENSKYKCIFCAHSTGNIISFLQGDFNFKINCNMCIIDKEICSDYGDYGMVGELKSFMKDDDSEDKKLYSKVKDICDRIYDHL